MIPTFFHLLLFSIDVIFIVFFIREQLVSLDNHFLVAILITLEMFNHDLYDKKTLILKLSYVVLGFSILKMKCIH